MRAQARRQYQLKRDRILLATIRASSREEIRIFRGDSYGRDIIEIRTWFTTSEKGQMRPSREGLAISAAIAAELVAVLVSAGRTP